MRRRPGLLVVTDPLRAPALAGIPTCTADAFLEGRGNTLEEDLTVINLCRSYGYLSKGYYVSLLADARHQRAYPSPDVIEEVGNRVAVLRTLRAAGVDILDMRGTGRRRAQVPKALDPTPSLRSAHPAHPLLLRGEAGAEGRVAAQATDMVEVTSVLGRTLDARFRKHCAAIFKEYGFPLLKVRMYRVDRTWKVGRIKPITVGQVTAEETALLRRQLSEGRFAARSTSPAPPRPYLIACLYEPGDRFRPSTPETLERFARVGAKRGILFETIGREDLPRLAEHDALFIRTVTAINHYSFQFAQQAESLGMPCIDDTQSIMRCSNKVYLHQIFRRHGIPTPRTLTVSRTTAEAEVEALGYPLILKLPDGTFSWSVKKARDRAEFVAISQEMFRKSPLVIVQEYIPTAFDWRVGILENEVLFACRYHMAKDHWQVVSRRADGTQSYGRVEAVPIADVPDDVRRIALESAALIGDGLYGVDAKETEGGPVVIEVNDNPNIDTGYEDVVEKDRIYEAILSAFVRRIQAQTQAVRAS